MIEWDVVDTGIKSAAENMRLDASFLEEADRLKRPILHFYEWLRPSVTYGYFNQPSQFLNLEAAELLSLDLARRPTGGGIVFHLFDMAFSVIVPSHCSLFSTNTLDNYGLVNQAVLACVNLFLKEEQELTLIEEDAVALDPSCSSFCMAKPTKYDVVCNGKKIAGAAQRKTKKGFLHQGTLALIMPSTQFLSSLLLPGSQVQSAMLSYTRPLLKESATETEMNRAKEQLKKILSIQLTGSSLV